MSTLKFEAAIRAAVQGNEGIFVPNLHEERREWEEWLVSAPVIDPLKDEDREVLIRALFPDKYGYLVQPVEVSDGGESG